MLFYKAIYNAIPKDDNFHIKLFVLFLFTFLISQNALAQDFTNTGFLTEEEQAWIADHPILKASSNTALAPFDFMSAGEPIGFSIDYLNLVGSKVGLKFEYINSKTWSGTLEKMKNKEIDLIHTITANEERAKYLNFSDPYFNTVIVNYGRVGSQRINSVEDLEGKKIGILKGHIIGDIYKKNHPNLELVEFNTYLEVLRALSLNKIDVYTDSTETIKFSIAQNNISGLEVIGDDFVIKNKIMDQRIAVHKDNQILTDIINKGVAAVSKQELIKISEKWIKNSSVNDNIDLTKEEQNWLSANNVIKVASDPNIAPLEFIDNDGEISGVAGDFLRIIGNKLNVKFVWANNNDLADGLQKIRNGQADVISAIAISEERKQEFILTEKYLSTRYMIFADEGSPLFNMNDDLSNLVFVQVKGYTVNSWLNEHYPNRSLVTVNNIDEALKMVTTGASDIYIGDIPTTSYYIAEGGYSNVKVVGTVEYTGYTVMAIRKDLPLLGSAMQKAMNSISEKEKIEISNGWRSLKIETIVDFTLLWIIIILGGSIFLIILIWNNKLRQEVAKRKLAEKKLVIKHKEAQMAMEISEKANAAKSDFLASMSHDLRTPLNAIIGFSETINEEVFGPVDNKKYSEYNKDIHASGKYLLQLVNDILDLSTLEAGKRELNYENIDIHKLLIECQNLVYKLAEEKNINFIINVPRDIPFIHSDRKALMQIMMNLMSNAIKFTTPNQNIIINAHVADNHYNIQVIDTGYGIAKKDIQAITEPFTKGVNSPFISHEEGSGLGLAIVRSLVELHDGKLTIISELNKGTTVTVSLPLQNETN